eukprot:21747-Pyramimonas_sp.AAC.1
MEGSFECISEEEAARLPADDKDKREQLRRIGCCAQKALRPALGPPGARRPGRRVRFNLGDAPLDGEAIALPEMALTTIAPRS